MYTMLICFSHWEWFSKKRVNCYDRRHLCRFRVYGLWQLTVIPFKKFIYMTLSHISGGIFTFENFTFLDFRLNYYISHSIIGSYWIYKRNYVLPGFGYVNKKSFQKPEVHNLILIVCNFKNYLKYFVCVSSVILKSRLIIFMFK